jgi:Flp pilus assembly protein TadG
LAACRASKGRTAVLAAFRSLARGFSAVLRDGKGNVGPLVAIMIVPVVGALGLATEASGWFLMQRSMQNAADSAVLAAAANGAPKGGTTYITEGRSVAANYGFTDGANNTTVTVVNNDNTIPATCNNTCYKVTITKSLPIYLTRIVGFTGNTALNGGRGETLQAIAIARPKIIAGTYCVLSLGTGDAIHINGGNSLDWAGCTLRSNGDVTCNGQNASGNADNIVYVGSNKNGKCSPTTQAASTFADPYSNLATNIPPNTCATSSPDSNASWPSGTNNLNSATLTWPATKMFCGDVKLSTNVVLTTASPGTVMVIENGKLDLNGHSLKTAAGSGLTIIFTSPLPDKYTTNATPTNSPTGNGTLDIAAPSSGTWSGVALYQDPHLPSGSAVDVSYSGNNPTWDITGLVYLPNSNVSFSGAVNKSTNGSSCFALVDWTLHISGTGNIYSNAQSQCAQAGLTPPNGGGGMRQALIQ